MACSKPSVGQSINKFSKQQERVGKLQSTFATDMEIRVAYECVRVSVWVWDIDTEQKRE